MISPVDVVKLRLQMGKQLSVREGHGRVLRLPEVVRGLWREEGVVAFFRGNWSATLLYGGYMAVQFPTYDACMRLFRPLEHAGVDPWWASAVAGTSAGAVATWLTYPLDLARTRFATQGTKHRVHHSIAGMFRTILQQEGWKGLYAGALPAVAEIGPRAGITFVAYELVRRQTKKTQGKTQGKLLGNAQGKMQGNMKEKTQENAETLAEKGRGERRQKEAENVAGEKMKTDIGTDIGTETKTKIGTKTNTKTKKDTSPTPQSPPPSSSSLLSTALASSVAGLAAGASGKLLLFPLDTIRRRMQTQSLFHSQLRHRSPHPPPTAQRAIVATARAIWTQEGALAFFRGVLPSLTKSAIGSSVAFAVYESVLQVAK